MKVKETGTHVVQHSPYAGLFNWLGPGASEGDMEAFIAVLAAPRATSAPESSAHFASQQRSQSLVMDASEQTIAHLEISGKFGLEAAFFCSVRGLG
jgi:hypothetical protein